MKPRVIGLTGGIATGKSEAASYLETLGAFIIDADKIARKVVLFPEIEQKLKQSWPQAFQNDLLLRGKLRQIIFTSKEERQKLNRLLHPVIIKETLKEIEASKKEICVVVAPLLIESGFHERVDEVWIIKTPRELEVRRLVERDKVSKEEASRMLASQLSTEEKLKYADKIFDNSGTLDDLKKELKKEWETLIQKINS